LSLPGDNWPARTAYREKQESNSHPGPSPVFGKFFDSRDQVRPAYMKAGEDLLGGIMDTGVPGENGPLSWGKGELAATS